MPKQIAVDTGPLVALFDRSDEFHRRAVDFFARFPGRGFVTMPVVTEVAHLLSFETEAQLDFLRWIKEGALKVEDVREDLPRMIELMEKYADQPMDLADASLVAVCERLRSHEIITLDGDFAVYRYRGRQLFRNLFQW